ncbi:MAG TPA: DinB family protein [Pyrinomonadaceae bacterium]|nr:DinB family protein [Pyrinomonadaceae bacterium]
MNQFTDQQLRDQLISLLEGGNAHVPFNDFIKDFPVEKCGQRVAGLPYTAWQIVEHMRIAQWDILEFSRNAQHVSPEWPRGYWPDETQTGSPELWQATVHQFQTDLQAFADLVRNSATDLFAPIPHGTGQTVLREALVLADHNSNHLGALVVIKRIVHDRA